MAGKKEESSGSRFRKLKAAAKTPTPAPQEKPQIPQEQAPEAKKPAETPEETGIAEIKAEKPQEPAEEYLTCPKCGNLLSPQYEFCNTCGEPVKKEKPVEAPEETGIAEIKPEKIPAPASARPKFKTLKLVLIFVLPILLIGLILVHLFFDKVREFIFGPPKKPQPIERIAEKQPTTPPQNYKEILAKIESLSSEVYSLEDQLAKYRTNIEELEKLKITAEKKSSLLEELRKEVDTAKQYLEASKHEQLVMAFNELHILLGRIYKDITFALKELTTPKPIPPEKPPETELQQKYQEVIQKLNSIKDRFLSIRDTLENFTGDRDTLINLHQEARQISKEFSHACDSFYDLKPNLTDDLIKQAEQIISSTEETKTTIDDKIDDLLAKVTKKAPSLVEVREKFREITSKIGQIYKQIENLKPSIYEAGIEKLKEIDDILTQSKNAISNLEKEADKIREYLDKTQEQQLTQQLSDATNTIDALKEQVSQNYQQIQDKFTDILTTAKTYFERISEIKQGLADATKQEVEKSKQEIEEYPPKITSLKAEYEKWQYKFNQEQKDEVAKLFTEINSAISTALEEIQTLLEKMREPTPEEKFNAELTRISGEFAQTMSTAREQPATSRQRLETLLESINLLRQALDAYKQYKGETSYLKTRYRKLDNLKEKIYNILQSLQ